MSKILEKPFSWASKIVRAVFKGSPSLVTTSDLNRQIEALKKEMYVLQQASSAIISDATASVDVNILSVAVTYVFCSGVRFDFPNKRGKELTFGMFSNETYELRLYAKIKTVTYEDDFDKQISGAKFADGTTQPAANHYVYDEPILKLVPAEETPNQDFYYPDKGDDGEYVCTLLRVRNVQTIDVPIQYCVQEFTIPMGKGVIDIPKKYNKFQRPIFEGKDAYYRDLVPNANDDWANVVFKLWTRLYALEKRLFMETSYKLNSSGIIDVNNKEVQTYRQGTITGNSDNFGNVEINYEFKIVGNICFVWGNIKVQKNNNGTFLTAGFGTEEASLPKPLCPDNNFIVMNAQGKFSCTINPRMGLVFEDIPSTGIINALSWSGSYCCSTKNIWKPSIGDKVGFFNDME